MTKNKKFRETFSEVSVKEKALELQKQNASTVAALCPHGNLP